MDCTELIKNLREDDIDDLYFSGMLMNEAADAIEKLQARIQKMDMEIEALLLLVTRKDNTTEALSKTETTAPKWIPVSECLPEDAAKYVFTWSDDYGDLDISCQIDFEPMGVTHWMPITYPEPPKEET